MQHFRIVTGSLTYYRETNLLQNRLCESKAFGQFYFQEFIMLETK